MCSALSTFSMSSIDGRLNWEIPLVSNILPVVVNENIFVTSNNGFVSNVDKKTGKIIWSKKIFTKIKKLTYEKTGDITSILFLSNTLFLTTENGYFIFLDYKNGEIKNYLKVSKSFLTRPIVVDGNIIIIDSNTRILKFD